MDCVFRRLQDDGNPSQLAALSRQSQIPDQQTQPAITGYPMPQVPTVRATEADEESTNERASVVPPHTRPNNLQNYMLNEESLALSSQRKINPRSQKCPDSAGHSVKPRSFRLVKSPSCKSLRHSTLSGGIQKFKSRRSDLAVFVEKAKDMFQPSNLHNLASVVSSERCQEIMKNELSIKNGPKPSQRKRPNATTEERRWRLENWSKEIKKSVAPDTIARQMVKNPLLRWDQDSMPLARQLHEIAIQEIETTGKSVGPGKSDIQPKPQLKHPLLQSQNDQVHQPDSTPEEIMKTSSQDDDEMDYVYDTYVRHDIDAAKPTSEVLEPYAHLTEAVVSTKIGVLMILEEDQELWEAYGEEPESDKDWNSEEEDENGMSQSRKLPFCWDACC